MARSCNITIAPVDPADLQPGQFLYAPLYRAVLADGDKCEYCGILHVGDKEAGQRLGVSERQIRNARFSGIVDEFVADRMCCIGLGLHPSAVMDTWALDSDEERQEAQAQAAEAKLAKKARVA